MIPLRIKITNTRAVKRADIQLSGLTVLCGPNGAGKSTIARVLEDAIETNLYFDAKHRVQILEGFAEDVLSTFRHCLIALGVEGFDRRNLSFRSLGEQGGVSHRVALKWLDSVRDATKNACAHSKWKQAKPDSREIKALAEKLAVKDVSVTAVERAFFDALDRLASEVDATIGEPLSYELFQRIELESPVLWKGDVDIREAETSVLAYRGTKDCRHSRLISVKDVVYIESPLVTTVLYDGGEISLAGNFASLHGKKIKDEQLSGDEMMSAFSGIMHGDVRLKRLPSGECRWVYRRDDKKEFPLRECATGLKSFSLLSTLHMYGCLNPETVLIIDEPEAHLHPQWVVEYAKMIVRIVSEYGVRTLIASHSPDMINALQAFAAAGGLSDHTHFYQALSDGGAASYSYKYVDRGMDVGKIFDTFNKVYPAIDKGVSALSRGQ